jgi:beta-glucanase (GH16 family)/glycerophosphoryl diester phosphodiesterase
MKAAFLVIIVLFSSCMVTRELNQAIRFSDNPVVAHRGAWKRNNLPENSIASLRKAIQLKCTGSEFDVRMTSDGTLIVNHDPTYHNLPIEETSYADLLTFKLSNGESLPTLKEYILAGMENNNSTRLVCEIKPSPKGKERGEIIAAKVLKLVHELKADKMVVYISFDYDILKKIIELNPKASTQYLEANKSPDQLKADGLAGLDYHFSAFSSHPEWIEAAKKSKLTLNAWTVNEVEDLDWLLAKGFDFITTNEPELLLERIAKAPVAAGWKLAWGDEFNYQGLPDAAKWTFEEGGNGWGNNEKQFYRGNSLANSFVKDGTLHVVALKEDFSNSKYTSAKLTTYQKHTFQYGKVEVRAKLPKGKGTWPAIWMLPESIQNKTEGWPLCGEIDIMEHVGKDQNMIHTSLHSELYNHVKGTQITHFERLQDVSDTFHKYGIEWSAEAIKFFIDDKLFFESLKGQNGRVSSNEGWPFDKPYYLILNLAVGGNWGGEIDESALPAEMQIDYVRVYHK